MYGSHSCPKQMLICIIYILLYLTFDKADKLGKAANPLGARSMKPVAGEAHR